MASFTRWGLKGLMLVLLFFMAAGCDTVDDLFENEKEVNGIVEAIGDNSLTVDGIPYTVTDKTEFDGFDSLSDLNVGDEVEVEYKENGGVREAVEIELGADSDD